MFCRKCGKEIPDDSVFCPKCGADCEIEKEPEEIVLQPIAEQQKPKRELLFCPYCATLIHEQDVKCKNCGKPLKTNDPPQDEKTYVVKEEHIYVQKDNGNTKRFASITGAIYDIILIIVAISLFGSGNCVCYAGDLYYSDEAVQTFVGTVIVGAIILGIANGAYNMTHKG